MARHCTFSRAHICVSFHEDAILCLHIHDEDGLGICTDTIILQLRDKTHQERLQSIACTLGIQEK